MRILNSLVHRVVVLGLIAGMGVGGIGAESVKYRLAMLPFGDGRSNKAENQRLGTIVEYALVELNRFEIVDRGNLDKVLKEQEFSLSDMASTNGQLKIGELVAAHYMVSGSVLDIVKHYDGKNKIYSVQLKTAFKILDIESGSYKDSISISKTGSSGNDYKTAESQAFDEVAAGVKSKIRALFPIDSGTMSVKSRVGGYYIVNVGKTAGADPGNAFFVYDPASGQTGEFSEPRGKLVVVDVGQTSSKCRLVSGKAEIGDSLKEDTAYRFKSFGAYVGLDSTLSGSDDQGLRNVILGAVYTPFRSPLIVDGNIAFGAFQSPFFIRFGASAGYRINTPIPELSLFPFAGAFFGIGIQGIPSSYLDELRDDYSDCGDTASGIGGGVLAGVGCMFRASDSVALTLKGAYAVASKITKWQCSEDDDSESSDSFDLDADRLRTPSFNPGGLSLEVAAAFFF